jgi:hypothetical protein
LGNGSGFSDAAGGNGESGLGNGSGLSDAAGGNGESGLGNGSGLSDAAGGKGESGFGSGSGTTDSVEQPPSVPLVTVPSLLMRPAGDPGWRVAAPRIAVETPSKVASERNFFICLIRL